jgi:hypothetical protein
MRLTVKLEKYIQKILVGFEVLTAASMKIAVFLVVAPCSLVEVHRRFRDAASRCRLN